MLNEIASRPSTTFDEDSPALVPKRMTPNQLKAYFLAHRKTWVDTKYNLTMSSFLRECDQFRNTDITDCVILGLGRIVPHTVVPFLAETMADCVKNSDVNVETLIFIEMLIAKLGSRHAVEKSYIQDPAFDEVETSFLVERGYTVLNDPEAFGKLTNRTLVIALGLGPDTGIGIFENCEPAMYIGPGGLEWLSHFPEQYPTKALTTARRFKANNAWCWIPSFGVSAAQADLAVDLPSGPTYLGKGRVEHLACIYKQIEASLFVPSNGAPHWEPQG